jgi:hypothetical protein
MHPTVLTNHTELLYADKRSLLSNWILISPKADA